MVKIWIGRRADLVRGHGDDGGQGEDEGVDVGHVEVVGCDGVGDRVGRHRLRRLRGKAHHVLRVHLDRVVAQLGLGHGLQGFWLLRLSSLKWSGVWIVSGFMDCMSGVQDRTYPCLTVNTILSVEGWHDITYDKVYVFFPHRTMMTELVHRMARVTSGYVPSIEWSLLFEILEPVTRSKLL